MVLLFRAMNTQDLMRSRILRGSMNWDLITDPFSPTHWQLSFSIPLGLKQRNMYKSMRVEILQSFISKSVLDVPINPHTKQNKNFGNKCSTVQMISIISFIYRLRYLSIYLIAYCYFILQQKYNGNRSYSKQGICMHPLAIYFPLPFFSKCWSTGSTCLGDGTWNTIKVTIINKQQPSNAHHHSTYI